MIPLSWDLAALELRADAVRERALADESGFDFGNDAMRAQHSAPVSRDVLRTDRDAARARREVSR